MDEFNGPGGGKPTKRIRENQGHSTDARYMPPDERDTAPRRKPKQPCTKEKPAPAFKQRDYVHLDTDELPGGNRRTVTLQCKWCGHNWREPR